MPFKFNPLTGSIDSVNSRSEDANFAGKVKISAGNDDNYFYLINTTASDADSARYSRMLFQGTQSGGEVTSLAAINGAHDGTGDDEKGVLTFRTNDGNDSESPTVRVTIDSAGDTHFTGDIALSQMKKVSFRDSGTQKAYIEIDGSNDVVYYGVAGTDHKFYANANPAVDINHDGIKLYGTRGIQFGNTAGANHSLDDYEEGSYTPLSGVTLTTALGNYVKIGTLVYASGTVEFPSSSSTGVAGITLPFTSRSIANNGGVDPKTGGMFIRYTNITNGHLIRGHVNTGSTTVELYSANGGSLFSYADVSTGRLDFNVVYQVDV